MAGKQDEPTAVAVVDPEGTVTGWSEGGRLLLGWTAQDIVGRPVTDLLVDPPPPGFPEGYGAGPDPTGPVPLRRRDGSTVDAVVTAHPLSGPDGRALGHAVTVQRWGRRPVIADRAFEQSPFALGVYDPDLRFLWINASSGRVIAHSEEQVLGKKYREVLPEFDRSLFPERDDKPYTDALAEVARTGDPTRLITVFRPRGSDYANAWATSIWPVRDAGGRVRAIANWGFDMSAEYWARQRLLILNKASGGIGRTLDVIGTAQELATTPVPEFTDLVTVDLFDEVLRGEEPPSVSALTSGEPIVLSRAARHSAQDDTDRAPGPTTPVSHPPGSVAARCMATGRSTVELAAEPGQGGEWAFGPGLAADPAHWPPGNPVIAGSIAADGLTGRITVPLRARGALLGVVAFSRLDRPEAFTADDLILAEELTAKAAVAIDNARRYSRERTTALTLQRSLLPQGLPNHEAVEVASRYLPGGAGAEVGGDWFDVIALSGARVALVVGDVVGHGLHASASMGRLRTAVRTLADVDLPPDELLTHLDDLVLHLAGDLQPTGHFQPAGETGATCLYTVYDPVSRRFMLASAGHPLPLIISPDGTGTPVTAQPGPPLGIGGLPFEATELELPEGSLLALYTDGLLDSRAHDVDKGIAELRRVLDQSATSLEALCDTVIDAVLPLRRTDDAALLLARTHALAPQHVADWDVEPDPAQVPHARKFAVDQVDAWGLEEAAFVTELVVSELVTNAIRYGEPPIKLRLIRDTSLICEVSDASNTAPHLRRARVFDEGGRGLLLVAQLTQGWGTRHTTDGKTIWCAQTLPRFEPY
ncbi:magnesium or manganese-dependent protein phosphatase [Streptomyces viridochromogenes DSM 40736]|uniref:Magnesium or manganese-dependent protein phosphatase n=1 Tax=Streptomyces viridochromogenes (strain DSM 40736 / JCM 4977 / BCRC 1201 / Tue 494) TaxID=591159 RepID=D9XAI9_STRVT|nr:SpoIIE family protein phosphatase [Streptomyces viridochromogenes]EFL30126.1 magnesium or manganese-dependent protein phosphatase [Streptomyces viridochromogenes DSM 40736]